MRCFWALGLAVAAHLLSASAVGAAPETSEEASCSTDEVLKEHRSKDSSLLQLDAGRGERQAQAQNPVRGPIGADTVFSDSEWVNPLGTTSNPNWYNLEQPQQADIVITTTAPYTYAMMEEDKDPKKKGKKGNKSKGKDKDNDDDKDKKKNKVPELKPAKELTKKMNETRKEAAKDCELSDWGPWGICEMKAGDLSRQPIATRYRQIITPRLPGGKQCGEIEEYIPCPSSGSDMNMAFGGLGGFDAFEPGSIQDTIAGMGDNATTNYGEPAPPEESEDGDGDGDGDGGGDGDGASSSSGSSFPSIMMG